MYLKLVLPLMVEAVACAREAFVVGGQETDIKYYPHSVYLNVICAESFMCGGSIINQLLVLTAAHCFEDCPRNGVEANIKYGHAHLDYMRSIPMKAYISHERYDGNTLANDISLVVASRAVKLSVVKRVALASSIPANLKEAYIAGWGVINSEAHVAQKLQVTVQELQPPQVCQLMGNLPQGSFCAGPISGTGAPDKGDSGSALMAEEFIQIGIVSFKVDRYSLVVYTNVSYHYSWIRKNAEKLMCLQDTLIMK